MVKIRLYIFLIFVLPLVAKAQLSEIGVFGGTTMFMGDVGNPLKPTGFVLGGVYRHQFDRHYALRIHGMYGKTSGNDFEATSSEFKVNRNLSFESEIIEAAILVEFNFFEYVTGSKKMKHTPYIFGGIGFFAFNPTSIYKGDVYELQTLSTEGQGVTANGKPPYNLVGLNIPFGLGYRWSLGDNTSIAFEIGFRATSTDFLDDVSGYYADKNILAANKGEASAYFSDRSITDSDKTGTMRGNADNNDWYTFAGVTLFFALTPQKERCKRF